MAYAVDLMGLGIDSRVATLVGFTKAASVTAAGTTTTDATVNGATADFVVLTGTGADGLRMNANSVQGDEFYITCISGGAKVYPHTGGTLNGGSTDAAITVGANKSAKLIRYSNTGWWFMLSA
jgi:hypothetical protein